MSRVILRQVMYDPICPVDLATGTAAAVLRHPLAVRSLVDGTTSRPIPYLDGRKLLRVTYLPPGYQFSVYPPFPAPGVHGVET